MNRFFYLPQLSPEDLLLKLLCLAGGVALIWWLLNLLFIHAFSRNKGDLAVARAGLWTLLAVFLLTHLYALLELNYNLAELGVEAMRQPSFYARFLPEILVSGITLTAFFLRKSAILQSIEVSRASN